MGCCLSKRRDCKLMKSKKRKKKKNTNRVSSSLSYNPSSENSFRVDHLRSFTNPTFQAGSNEEVWYDSLAFSGSEFDEDFLSVQDDVLSLGGLERATLNWNDSVLEVPKQPVLAHDLSSVGSGEVCRPDTSFDNCGILASNSLPLCLTSSTVPSIDKGRSLLSSPNSIKNNSSRHLFKWGDVNRYPTLVETSKRLLAAAAKTNRSFSCSILPDQ